MEKLCDKLECEDLEPIVGMEQPYCHHMNDIISDETYKNCKHYVPQEELDE